MALEPLIVVTAGAVVATGNVAKDDANVDTPVAFDLHAPDVRAMTTVGNVTNKRILWNGASLPSPWGALNREGAPI